MASKQGTEGKQPDTSPTGNHPTFESIRASADALRAEQALLQEDDRTLRAIREGRGFENLEFQKAQADQTRALTEEIRQTQVLREKYAERVYRLLRWWVFVAIAVLVLDALDPPAVVKDIPWIHRLIPAFDIEKQIMLGFLGGTTVAVVGLVLAVVKGLFPSSPKD